MIGPGFGAAAAGQMFGPVLIAVVIMLAVAFGAGVFFGAWL